MTVAIPYTDVRVPLPPETKSGLLNYESWISQARTDGFDLLKDAGLSAFDAAGFMGPMAAIAAGAAGGPVGSAVAAAGFGVSVLSSLFGGSSPPIQVKPIAGFDAALMQRTPLRDDNTAVAAGKLIAGQLDAGSGLRASNVKTNALAQVNAALRGYENDGWAGLQEELGFTGSKRSVALFVASTKMSWLAKELAGPLRSHPARVKGLAKLQAYGAPRLQVREVLFYRGLRKLYDELANTPTGFGSALDQTAAGRALKTFGPDVLEQAAAFLAVPRPRLYGKSTSTWPGLWTFNTLQQDVVGEELTYYQAHKLAGVYNGRLFEVPKPTYYQIDAAIRTAMTLPSGYKGLVEDDIESMEAAAKGKLSAQRGTKLERESKSQQARQLGGNGPLIAAGVAAAGLGALWLLRR